MSNLSEDDHALLARLVPQYEQHEDDRESLTAWVATLTPHEMAVLVRWAQHRIKLQKTKRDHAASA
jgi:hypothetical protein